MDSHEKESQSKVECTDDRVSVLCCYVSAVRARIEGLVRSRSRRIGSVRPLEREDGERQVGRERRPGAACGLDSYVPPSPLPSFNVHRRHIIYDSI